MLYIFLYIYIYRIKTNLRRRVRRAELPQQRAVMQTTRLPTPWFAEAEEAAVPLPTIFETVSRLPQHIVSRPSQDPTDASVEEWRSHSRPSATCWLCCSRRRSSFSPFGMWVETRSVRPCGRLRRRAGGADGVVVERARKATPPELTSQARWPLCGSGLSSCGMSAEVSLRSKQETSSLAVLPFEDWMTR